MFHELLNINHEHLLQQIKQMIMIKEKIHGCLRIIQICGIEIQNNDLVQNDGISQHLMSGCN
jgi:hypothetical protein